MWGVGSDKIKSDNESGMHGFEAKERPHAMFQLTIAVEFGSSDQDIPVFQKKPETWDNTTF